MKFHEDTSNRNEAMAITVRYYGTLYISKSQSAITLAAEKSLSSFLTDSRPSAEGETYDEGYNIISLAVLEENIKVLS